ncbi:hypothetical protein GCM10010467_26690 [Actinocorallia glomerata]|uniref:Integrase catalytic domain-containing protein n=2 Tax=Actinomycetes TaxID=1760 RepID=A0ABP6M2X6_9MICC
MLTGMILSLGTGTLPTKQKKPATPWPTALPGGSVPPGGVFSVISRRKKGKGTRPGPPVHDDLVRRQFTTVKALNEVWLTDITEHQTGEGKLYLYAVKDACSRRMHRPQRPRQPIPLKEVPPGPGAPQPGRIHGQSRCRRG